MSSATNTIQKVTNGVQQIYVYVMFIYHNTTSVWARKSGRREKQTAFTGKSKKQIKQSVWYVIKKKENCFRKIATDWHVCASGALVINKHIDVFATSANDISFIPV